MLVILEGRKHGWVLLDTFLEIGNWIMCTWWNNFGHCSTSDRRRRRGHKSSGGKVWSNSELINISAVMDVQWSPMGAGGMP
jgi:hypothetical protein